MSDSHHDDHNPMLLDAINDPVIAHTNPPVIGLTVEFLSACRKGILSQFRNLRRDAPLYLAVERSEFPQR
jgi:hypothetical protein